MISQTTRKIVFALALALLAVPAGHLRAQKAASPNETIVCGITGTDPEPVGHVVGDPEPCQTNGITGTDPEPVGHFDGDLDASDIASSFWMYVFFLLGL